MRWLSNCFVVMAVFISGVSQKLSADTAKTLQAQSSPLVSLSLPYVAGPDLYYFVVETKFYDVKMVLNGIETPVDARSGLISISDKFRFEGDIASNQRFIVNAYLRPGNNSLLLLFSGGEALAAAKQSQLLDEEMLQPMIKFKLYQIPHKLVKGSKISDEDLEISLKKGAKILAKFQETPKLKDAKLTYAAKSSIKLDPKVVKFAQTPLSACEWDTDRTFKMTGSKVHYEPNASGKILVNEQEFEIITYTDQGTSSEKTKYGLSFQPLIGKNSISYHVTKLGKSKPEHIQFGLECDLNQSISTVIPQKVMQVVGSSFGNFLNKLKIPAWSSLITKPGEYKGQFDYKDK